MSPRVALYARVSTTQQVATQTIEQQLTLLQTHVEQEGWGLADTHVFRDEGRSGSSLQRPGLDRLRDVVRLAEVDLVLVSSPDRLARNYVHQMVLLDELAGFGCQVEFLDRPLSDDPHDRLLLQIRSAVAEYERTLIAERMRRGRLAKYKAGLLLPWTRPPYGYRLAPESPRDPTGVRVDDGEAAVVQALYTWYDEEQTSLRSLVKRLHEAEIPSPRGNRRWSLSAVRGILRQPAYTGQVYARRYQYHPPQTRRSPLAPVGKTQLVSAPRPEEDWIFVAKIPALVTEAQYERVQKKLLMNQSYAKRNTKHEYLLRAMVSCGVCQSACTPLTRENGRYHYYRCQGKRNPLHSGKAARCPSRFAPANKLDDLVWQDLSAVLTHPDSLTVALEQALSGAWLPQALHQRQTSLQQGRKNLNKQLERLTEAYLAAVIPLQEYQRRRPELEEKLQLIEEQTNQVVREVDRKKELAGLVSSVEAFCQRVQIGLANASFAQKRHLVELLVDRVIFTEGEVEIRYVIPLTPESEQVRFCHLRSDYLK